MVWIACTACAATVGKSDDRGWARAEGTATYQCGDTVLDDQVTSGGVPVMTARPCWDTHEEALAHQRHAARQDREAALADSHSAEQLAAIEQAACRTIEPREREHSPFQHRKEIAEIVPHREAGALRGVRVVFKPVAGLTAEWMRRDIACHRARWGMYGKDALLSPEDPTLVDGADVQVTDRHDHIEVLVTTESAEQAELALARAEGKLVPATPARHAKR